MIDPRTQKQLREDCATLETEITLLRADLAAAGEQVAGAYLAAADARFLMPLISDQSCGEWDDKTIAEDAEFFGAAIKALAPADAIAALEARDARVRAEERAKVIAEAKAMKWTTFHACRFEEEVVSVESLGALHTEASREVK